MAILIREHFRRVVKAEVIFTCGPLETVAPNRITADVTDMLGVYTPWLSDQPVKPEDFRGMGKDVLLLSLRRTAAARITIK